jgi:hypothetical protein
MYGYHGDYVENLQPLCAPRMISSLAPAQESRWVAGHWLHIVGYVEIIAPSKVPLCPFCSQVQTWDSSEGCFLAIGNGNIATHMYTWVKHLIAILLRKQSLYDWTLLQHQILGEDLDTFQGVFKNFSKLRVSYYLNANFFVSIL